MQKYGTPHVEINLQDLQVCKSCKLQIQVIEFEGRNNGRRRPEKGPRPGPATPPGGGGGNNFPGLIQCSAQQLLMFIGI